MNKDDWRLQGQDKYLLGKTLYFRQWKAQKQDWDHDHCEFCCDKFSNLADGLHVGYTTKDHYYWICTTCYNDFKEMFGWNVIEEK